MEISILGRKWSILEKSQSVEPRLEGCDGFCDWTTREIIVEREMEGNLGNMEPYIRKVKRHEIIHAFLLESGLAECSGECESWAENEAMVDWYARMGPRIYSAWIEADAITVEDRN